MRKKEFNWIPVLEMIFDTNSPVSKSTTKKKKKQGHLKSFKTERLSRRQKIERNKIKFDLRPRKLTYKQKVRFRPVLAFHYYLKIHRDLLRWICRLWLILWHQDAANSGNLEYRWPNADAKRENFNSINKINKLKKKKN